MERGENMQRRPRTRTLIVAIVLGAMLTGPGAALANGHPDVRLEACPSGRFAGPDASIFARRPGAVIYEVRADRAQAFAVACGASARWTPRTPTRFG